MKLSGNRVEVQQYRFIKEYTISKNADLYVSVFNITRLRQFGDFDSKEMYKMFLKSVTFSEMTINIRYVKESTVKIMNSLQIDF